MAGSFPPRRPVALQRPSSPQGCCAPRGFQRRPRQGAWCLVLACLAACGGGAEAPHVPAEGQAQLQRPELRLLRRAQDPAPSSEVVLHLDANQPEGSAQHLGTHFAAGGPARLETVKGTEDRALALFEGGAPTLVLTAPGASEENRSGSSGLIPSYDTVLVRAVFHTPTDLQAVAKLDGGEIQRTIPLAMKRQPGVQLVRIDMARLAERQMSTDELRIEFSGRAPGVQVLSIDLLRTPVGKRLPGLDEPPVALDLYSDPDVSGEGRRVDLCSDARPVRGLVSGAPQGCAIEVTDPFQELRFSVAQLPEVRALGQKPVLRALVLEGKEILIEESVRLENSPSDLARWHDLVLPLGEHVGKQLRLRLDLLVGDEESGGKGGGQGTAVCGVTPPVLVRRGAGAPLVLLITSDTHRADHVAVSPGAVELATPNLDALAARGVLFSDTWSTTNVTSPSHVALMTGLHPRDSGVLHNTSRLSARADTVAEAFRDAGWMTLGVVSVRHLGPSGTDLAQGFERMIAPPGPPWDAQYATAQLESMLAQADGQPVFAWLHVFDAHVPYEPPARFAEAYWNKGRDAAFDPALPDLDIKPGSIPAPLQNLRDLDYPKALYRGEISYLDDALGSLLNNDRVLGGLVAFTSDHGEILAKDGTYFNHGEIFPDTLHVPLILAGDQVPGGVVCETPVSQRDLGRSLLDLAGLAKADLPGRNLLYALEGEGAGPERFGLSAHARSASITLDRDGRRLHLILHLTDHGTPLARKRMRHTFELYDLVTDPECLTNLAPTENALSFELRGRLVEWLGQASKDPVAESRTTSAEALAELRDLGYAAGDDAPEAPESGGHAYIDPDCSCAICELASND